MKFFLTLLLATFFIVSGLVQAGKIPRSESPEGARLYIISPADGEVVGNKITFMFPMSHRLSLKK